MEPPRPSVFTPFLRRFTDERSRDVGELQALHEEVATLFRCSTLASETALVDFGMPIFESYAETLPPTLSSAFARSLADILALEQTVFAMPRIEWGISQLSLKEQVDLQHFLYAKRHVLTNERRIVSLLYGGVRRLFSAVFDDAPDFAGASPFTTPLVTTLRDPRRVLQQLYVAVWDQALIDAGLFVELGRIMHLNACAVSRIDDPLNPKGKPFLLPVDNDDPPAALVEAYFRNTPLHDLLLAPVPLALDFEARFRHMHVVGGSGAGKTQFLQQLILHDLEADDPPALVIVDGQTDLIKKLSNLALFEPDLGPLADRLVLITPRDLQYPPALNIFDLNRGRLGSYDEQTREQVTAGVIETFDYLFAGLLGADLTAKQGVFFRFVARLMLALPDTLGRNATILDMLALMDDAGPYRPAIERLPPIARAFFERDFPSKTFAQTKEQIRYRLNAILENPTLARLFTSPNTRVDLFSELNQGSIILIDTAKDFLKGASGPFGRIFISLVLQAVLERAALPEHERRPAFLIVDEAASYFDSNIDDLLTEARKYKLGCVFAHQFLDQCTGALRASLAANTAIQSQPRLHFAAHVRSVTPEAVSIPVEPGLLERQPVMSSAAATLFRERNRLRVSIPAGHAEMVDVGPSTESERGDDDLTKPREW
jgi:hypothetical protein